MMRHIKTILLTRRFKSLSIFVVFVYLLIEVLQLLSNYGSTSPKLGTPSQKYKFKFKANIWESFLNDETRQLDENEHKLNYLDSLEYYDINGKDKDTTSNNIFQDMLDTFVDRLQATKITYVPEFESDSKSQRTKQHPSRHQFKPQAAIDLVSDPNMQINFGTLMNLMSENPFKSEDDLINYKESHGTILGAISQMEGESKYRFYKGKGIVLLGGGNFTWFSTLSLISMRRAGSTLPVEIVFTDYSDYDKEMCDGVISKHNAKCVKAWEVMGEKTLNYIMTANDNQELGSKQREALKLSVMKIVALISSSFDEVIYTEPNSMTTFSPDSILESRVFKRYRLIEFADFERRTTSPMYYQILNRGIHHGNSDVPKRFLNDIYSLEFIHSGNYHDLDGTISDYSTFDDVVIISKNLHFKTLFLSLYYSINGNLYSTLLNEIVYGDEVVLNGKEMITAASSYWGMSGYQPFRRPVLDFEEETIYWEEKLLKSPSESKIKHERRIKQRQNRDLEMSVSNVMQFDPSIDYLNLVEVLKDLDGRKKKVKKYDYSMFDEDFIGNKPVFIHFSEQSREMMADPIKFYKTLKFVGERKLSTKFPMMQFDIEQYYWRMVKFLLCESNATFLFGEYFEDGEMGTMCKDFVDGHIEALDEHEHVLVNAFFSK